MFMERINYFKLRISYGQNTKRERNDQIAYLNAIDVGIEHGWWTIKKKTRERIECAAQIE